MLTGVIGCKSLMIVTIVHQRKSPANYQYNSGMIALVTLLLGGAILERLICNSHCIEEN